MVLECELYSSAYFDLDEGNLDGNREREDDLKVMSLNVELLCTKDVVLTTRQLKIAYKTPIPIPIPNSEPAHTKI